MSLLDLPTTPETAAPAVDLAEMKRLQRRERESEAEIKRLTAENRELALAAETSRNFRADLDTGNTTIDLDSWGNP